MNPSSQSPAPSRATASDKSPTCRIIFTAQEPESAFTVEIIVRGPGQPVALWCHLPNSGKDQSLHPAKLKRPGGRPQVCGVFATDAEGIDENSPAFQRRERAGRRSKSRKGRLKTFPPGPRGNSRSEEPQNQS